MQYCGLIYSISIGVRVYVGLSVLDPVWFMLLMPLVVTSGSAACFETGSCHFLPVYMSCSHNSQLQSSFVEIPVRHIVCKYGDPVLLAFSVNYVYISQHMYSTCYANSSCLASSLHCLLS